MRIENKYGYIEFDYKTDLNEEEGNESYLPEFYQDSVLELKFIKAFRKGGGHQVMQVFLTHPEVQQAKLIFLDCSPLFQEDNEILVMQRLHDFYAQYGFIGTTNDGYSRLWLVQKLPSSSVDCFSKGYDEENDLHPILRSKLPKPSKELAPLKFGL